MKKLCFYYQENKLSKKRGVSIWVRGSLYYCEVILDEIDIERLDEHRVENILRSVLSSITDGVNESYSLIKWEIVNHREHSLDLIVQNAVRRLLKSTILDSLSGNDINNAESK